MPDAPKPPRSGDTDDEGGMVQLRFLVPRAWRDELRRIADDNGQKVAVVARMAIRAILPRREP